MKLINSCLSIYLLLTIFSASQAAPFLVEDTCPGPDNSAPEGFTPLNGKMLFHIDRNCDEADYGLYISDGTRPGTHKIHDVTVYGAKATKANWLVVGNIAYFPGSLGGSGVELWLTNGTTSGTRLVKDLVPGGSSAWPKEFVRMNGIIYFIAEATGFENGLYRTNGTATGTWLVKGFNDDISGLSVTGNSVLFRYGNTDLWVSNGTPAGTTRLKSFRLIENLMSLNNNVVLYNALEFGKDYITPRLGRSNGVASGTFILSKVENCQLSWYRQFEHYPGNVLYFSSSCSGDLSDSLWRTNGTNAGTIKLKEINNLHTFFLPDFGSKNVGFGTAYYNNEFYFVGSDNIFGYEIWKTNGTSAGTKRVTNVCTGNSPALTRTPKILGTHSSGVYFVSDNCPFVGRTLWVTRGLPGTTHTVLRGTGVTLPRFSTKEEVRSVGPYLYLHGKTAATGEELFVIADEDPNEGLGRMVPSYLLLLLSD